jgi:hypothetical protein
MEVRIDHRVDTWLTTLSTDVDLHDVYADCIALIDAVATYGQRLIEPESKPIHSSLYLHELRRTPPSDTAPLADQPPIIRILYAFCRTATGETIALVLVGGDKTELGNNWYPTNIATAHTRLTTQCGIEHLTPLQNTTRRT